MQDSILDVAGIEVGSSEDQTIRTGCTVVLCKQGATVGVDVRGAAPATRETDLCRSGNLVSKVHAILLTGGSAFGLDSASGVMRFLWERGIGFDTPATRVPIVPAAAIYDLNVGRVGWPHSEMAYQACREATSKTMSRGRVGAGTGATVGKILGPKNCTEGGLGSASERVGSFRVGALVVVNALGDVVDPNSGKIIAGPKDPLTGNFISTEDVLLEGTPSTSNEGQNTTLVVVATDAPLSKEQANRLASISHDGLARVIRPAHTLVDGDVVFALSTTADNQVVTTDQMIALGVGAIRAVERAILDAVKVNHR